MSKGHKITRHLGHGSRWGRSTYTVDGITDDLSGWAKRLGTTYICLYKRIALRGMSPEDAFRQGAKAMNRKELTANGETHTLAEWGRLTGIDADLISERLLRGRWTVEEALGLVPHDPLNEKPIKWRGKTRNIIEWAKFLGLNEGLFRMRVHQWRNGIIPKKDVFRKEIGHAGRKQVSLMKWYKGKKYSVPELAEKKGVGLTWFRKQIDEGHSIFEIMEHIEPCRDPEEIAARSRDGYLRNLRMRELRKMGIVI